MGSVTKGAPTVIPPIPFWLLMSVYVLYLGLATTASVPLFADIDWLHEGERLGTAQVVLSGGLPFRDVYLPHGLFPEVIRPLLAFEILGESLAADRFAGILLAPLPYVAAVFYVWKLFPTRFWRFARLAGIALYPLLLVPRHVVVFLALGLLTGWVREGRRKQLFGAGLLAGSGFIFSTIDQASFLLATVALFPFVVTAQRYAACREEATTSASTALWEVSKPLLMGMAIGGSLFLVYLLMTGTAGLFVQDLVRRSEADAYAFSHVWGHESFPVLSPANAVWYVIPFFYVAAAVIMAARVRRKHEEHWDVLIPTLLFGILSFAYALRQFNYWKLAVVSFPFVAGGVYFLSTVAIRETGRAGDVRAERRLTGEWGMVGLTAVLMAALLVQSLTRDWKPKQVAPQVFFPTVALLILSATAFGMSRRGRSVPVMRRTIAISPLVAVIVSVWFYNDAKPQVLSAQIKKPRLVGDVGQLLATMADAGGHVTRDRPLYLNDEVLAYLKTQSLAARPVVILAAGAGIYYFHAGVVPPNRFPHVEIAMAEAWAREVVDGLDRTRADLLVACKDEGKSITDWPMNPKLSNFIASHYVDSGRRLGSKLLGQDCPFSVWIHRQSLNGTPT